MRYVIELDDSEPLALDATPARGDAPLVLYLHGLGSHRGGTKATYLEQELTARGFGFARFDFRGHGESGGSFDELSMSRQLADVAAVVSELASGRAGTPPRALLLVGASLGGLIAAWHALLAPERPLPILGQVLIAPAFRLLERYLAAVGPDGRARWEREGRHHFVGPWFEFDLRWQAVLDAQRYPHQRLLDESRVPLLLIHGTADETTPVQVSEEFARQCVPQRPRLVTIAGGDHRLTAHRERLRDLILEFAQGVVR